MGQTYSVEAKFVFKNNDKTSFCNVFKNEVNSRNGITANFNLTKGCMDEPFGCFNILTGGYADISYDEKGNSYTDIWRSDFDGSYGWESVMYEVFTAVLKECEDGSYVRIWPDNGETLISVENGKVILKNEEDDE